MSSHASPVDAGGLSHAEEHSALRGAPARIAAVSLFVTACLLVLKLTLGLLSGSIAVLSDAVDSGTDLVGGAAALFSIRISRMPEDEEHPFGHGKIEAVSAAVAATVIGLGGGLVTYQAVRRLVEGSPEIHVGVGLIAMSVAAVANVVMALFMRREATRSHSMALAAEATHLTTNIVQASAIIAGLLLVQVTGKVFFDPLTALALAAYMAWIARGLVVTALGEVMDTRCRRKTCARSRRRWRSTRARYGDTTACAHDAPGRRATSICTCCSTRLGPSMRCTKCPTM